jgi:hypothetical protein
VIAAAAAATSAGERRHSWVAAHIGLGECQHSVCKPHPPSNGTYCWSAAHPLHFRLWIPAAGDACKARPSSPAPRGCVHRCAGIPRRLSAWWGRRARPSPSQAGRRSACSSSSCARRAGVSHPARTATRPPRLPPSRRAWSFPEAVPVLMRRSAAELLQALSSSVPQRAWERQASGGGRVWPVVGGWAGSGGLSNM